MGNHGMAGGISEHWIPHSVVLHLVVDVINSKVFNLVHSFFYEKVFRLIEAKTKWLPFRKQHFQMLFLE